MPLMFGTRSMLGKRKRASWQSYRRPTRVGFSPAFKRLAAKTRAVALSRTGGYTGGRFELKYHDEALSGHLVTNDMTNAIAARAENATNNQLCGIVQGSASNQRIGRCAFIKSIYVQGHIRQPAAAAMENSGYVTLWLVEDKQTNGAPMSPINFLENISGTNLDADAMQNLAYSDRFRLLAKKKIRSQPRNVAGNGTNTDSASLDIPFKIYKKVNIKKEHSGNTAVVGDVTNSSIHLIALRSESMHATTEISYVARVRFTD